MVHWEVQARDLPRQQQFFGELFGWKIDTNNPMSYGMVVGRRQGHHRRRHRPGDGRAPRVTFYVQVRGHQRARSARRSRWAAQTMVPRTEFGGVIMALFRDLEDNVIGLVEG